MKAVMIVLAVLNLLLASFVSLVGNFADGDRWQSALLMSHFVAAVLLLFAAAASVPISRGLKKLTALVLLMVVTADVTVAYLISAGEQMKGDPELMYVLAAVPAIGLCYLLSLKSR